MNETKPMMNQQDDERARNAEESFIDIVFDGPPSHESGRFVEVEQNGKSIKFGEWVHREDAYWALRIPSIAAALQQARREGMEMLIDAIAPPSHEGACIAGITSCDGACMDRAGLFKTAAVLEEKA